jgi:hypothetical protein
MEQNKFRTHPMITATRPYNQYSSNEIFYTTTKASVAVRIVARFASASGQAARHHLQGSRGYIG